MAAEFKIEGLDGVLQKMRTLAPKLQKRGLRQGARQAMNIVRDAARSGAQAIDDPETKERIFKNIAVQEATKQSKSVGGVVMRVGVLGGARQYSDTKANARKRRVGKTYKTGGDKSNPGGDTFHWRFVEFGTEHQQAKPFMRPALANNVDRVTDKFVEVVNASIDRIIATGK